jgi:molybdopterin converting factor small subunit
MKVRVKLFATLMDCLPAGTKGNEVVVEAAEDACIGEVLERFSLPERLTHLVLVNGSFVAREARPTWQLKEGDHLAVWPPVAGG